MNIQWAGWIVAAAFAIFAVVQQAMWQGTITEWESSSKEAFAGWQKALDGWKGTCEEYRAFLVAAAEQGKDRKS